MEEDLSPLPDILSHGMKMVVWNQENLLSQVLRNWPTMSCKKQSSVAISSSRLQNIMCAPRMYERACVCVRARARA